MARYYKQPNTGNPISQFAPTNLGFIQGQIDKSQQRFDLANAAQAKTFSLLNEVDTTNDADRERRDFLIGGLHDKMNEIEERYNGNLGAASSEITNMIANARNDQFWKKNEYANKLNEEYRAEKQKLGVQGLDFSGPTSAWDPTTQRYRSKEEMGFDLVKRSNREAIRKDLVGGLQASSLSPNSLELAQSWENALAIKNYSSEFIRTAKAQGITPEMIDGLANDESVISSFLSSAPDFIREQKELRGKNDQEVRDEAALFLLGGLKQKEVTRFDVGAQRRPPPAASSGPTIPTAGPRAFSVFGTAGNEQNIAGVTKSKSNYRDAKGDFNANQLSADVTAAYNLNEKSAKELGQVIQDGGTGTSSLGTVIAAAKYMLKSSTSDLDKKKFGVLKDGTVISSLNKLDVLTEEYAFATPEEKVKIKAKIDKSVKGISTKLDAHNVKLAYEFGDFERPLFDEIDNYLTGLDDNYLNGLNNSINSLTKEHSTIFNHYVDQQKTKNKNITDNAANKGAFKQLRKSLDNYEKNFKLVSTAKKSYPDSKELSSDIVNALSLISNFDNTKVNGEVIEEGNPFRLMKGDASSDLKVDYSSGELIFNNSGNKDNENREYRVSYDDIAKSFPQAAKVLAAPKQIAEALVSISEDGFGLKQFNEPIDIVGKDGNIHSAVEYSLTPVGDDPMNKKIEVLGRDNDGNQYVIARYNPGQINKLYNDFGNSFAKSLISATKKTN